MQRQSVETLAKASWALPLLAFFLNTVASSQGRAIAFAMALVGAGIYLLALICGIIALLMVRKFGKEKILVHAIVGTILSGLLVLLMLGVMILAVAFRASHA